MKVSLYPGTNIDKIPADVTGIHLVRPVSHEKIEKALEKCGNIREITLSNSCMKRLSGTTKKMLRSKVPRIDVLPTRGRAIEIPMQRMLQAIEMAKDHRPLREIEELTGIPKSTVHYLVRYADRKKVKQGTLTIHLG